MDQKLNDIINNVLEIRENNSFFNDLLSSKELMDNSFNDSKHSIEMKSTPTLEMPKKLTNKRNLFGFYDKENSHRIENEQRIDINMSSAINKNNSIVGKSNEYLNNSLGLSPVRKQFLKDNNSYDFNKSLFSNHSTQNNETNEMSFDLDDIQVNSFPLNQNSNNTFEDQSVLMDESFKSLSKCSDLDLKANEQNHALNETFLSPNSEFENKSINSYFKQNSEPLSGINLFGISDQTKNDSIVKKSGNETTFNFDEKMSFEEKMSFISVTDEISASDNTLLIAQRIIDRNNRKRKADKSNALFIPSINSTGNLCKDNSSDGAVLNTSVLTSGLGTASTSQLRTDSTSQLRTDSTSQLRTDSKSSSSNSTIGNTLSLNQLIVISPNILSLTIGCFVSFKLNYLKVKNLSITSFKAHFKLSANVDTLNDLQISLPSEAVSIPAFFDGLLTNEITITPLKCGSFTFVLQIYPSIENIHLPISPLSVVCQIKSEVIHIKRLHNPSNSSQINYNLFQNNENYRTVDLVLSNEYFSNEIALKFCLEPSKCLTFEPLYRLPDSTIHSFRCPNVYTLYLVTKTQYEMKIPLKIQSFGEQNAVSTLTVAIDSVSNAHVLAVYRLSATFWPKRELREASLQCSDSSISLARGKWKRINFRNKSINNAIQVKLECTLDKSVIRNFVTFSTSEFIIGPLSKISIALMIDNNAIVKSDGDYHLLAKHDSGLGKSWSVLIPILFE